jgi:hypothetical protein
MKPLPSERVRRELAIKADNTLTRAEIINDEILALSILADATADAGIRGELHLHGTDWPWVASIVMRRIAELSSALGNEIAGYNNAVEEAQADEAA